MSLPAVQRRYIPSARYLWNAKLAAMCYKQEAHIFLVHRSVSGAVCRVSPADIFSDVHSGRCSRLAFEVLAERAVPFDIVLQSNVTVCRESAR